MKKLVMMLTLLMATNVAVANCGTTNSVADAACRAGINRGAVTPQTNQTQEEQKGLRWEVCINGINLQGEQCQGDTWGQWDKPKQITATGRDAMEVIRNGDILASGIDNQGQYRLIVIYKGQYRPARGKTFSCTVSQDARRFECRSWSPTHRTNY